MLKDLLRNISNLSNDPNQYKKVFLSFILQIVSVILGFIASLVLANIFGAKGLGIFVFVFSWVSILGVMLALGYDTLLVREIAKSIANNTWGKVKGILRWANTLVLIISSLFTIAVLTLLFKYDFNLELEKINALWLGIFILPFIALTAIRQAALKGFKKVIGAQLPDRIIRPIIFIVFIVFAYLFLDSQFTPEQAILLNMLAIIIAFFIGAYLLQGVIPSTIALAQIEYDKKVWLRSAAFFMLFSLIKVLSGRLDIVMLGVMKDLKDVGIYSTAFRFAEFIPFILVAIDAVLAPVISKLFANGKMDELQVLVTKHTRLAFLVALPILLLFILLGKWVLLPFGYEFLDAKLSLIILCIGQFTYVLVGPVGYLLMMTGEEKWLVYITALTVFLNFILNLLWIPNYGIEGAAYATSVSLGLWNILMAIAVHKNLKIKIGLRLFTKLDN